MPHARSLAAFLRAHLLLLFTAFFAVASLLSGRITMRQALHAIDVDLLLVLFALLVTVELLRASGWLDALVVQTVTRLHDERTFGMVLIALSGAVAALVTNDVALFIVIPFTIAASRISTLRAEGLVVLEIIAANVLGCLTPLGNPQNLFLFHRSGWSALTFLSVMLPFVALSAAALFAALLFVTRNRPIELAELGIPPRSHRLAIAGAICLLLVLLEIARLTSGWPAAITAFAAGVALLRRRMFRIDLSIVPLFFFAFIIVEALRQLDVNRLLDLLPFATASARLYVAALALSQFISNVPATVLLAPLAHDAWRPLLYGVNAGGCGTIIASLANLLGWRIYMRESGRDRYFFHRLSVANALFLLWIGIAAWWVL